MAKRLYVGNIAFKATEDDLKEFFTSTGQVESIRMILVPQTGQPKGFAFIEMVSDQDAKNAIASLNGKTFMGRELRVSEARPSQPLAQRSSFSEHGSLNSTRRTQGRF